MARARYYDVIQFPDPATGLIHKVDNVQVTVYEEGTTTPLGELIYQADTGSSTYTNPRTITDGVLEFFLNSEKRVSIKFDATASGYGIVTKDYENVWPDPSELRTSIRSPNGLYEATLGNDRVFRAPGLLRYVGAWHASDFDIQPGSGAGLAATNAANFQIAVAEIFDTLVGGRLLFDGNTYPFDPINMSHSHGIGIPIWLEGVPGITKFRFHGASGYGGSGAFLEVGDNSLSQIARGGIKGIMFFHNETPNVGATIRLGMIQTFRLEDVAILYDSADKGALIGVQLGKDTLTVNDVTFEKTKIWAGLSGGTRIAVDVNVGGSGCGAFKFYNTQMKANSTNGIGLRFNNATLVDTVELGPGAVFETCLTNLQKNSGAGEVANFYARGAIFDSAELYCVRCEPSGLNRTWSFEDCWFSSNGIALLFTSANGGQPDGITIKNASMIGGHTGAIYIGDGVHRVNILNNIMMSTNVVNPHYTLEVGATGGTHKNRGVNIANNIVVASAGATKSIKVRTGVLSGNVQGNSVQYKPEEIDPTPGTRFKYVASSYDDMT